MRTQSIVAKHSKPPAPAFKGDMLLVVIEVGGHSIEVPAIAAETIQPGESGRVFTDGTFMIPKDPSERFVMGDQIFYDFDRSEATRYPVGPPRGVCIDDAELGALSVSICLSLNQSIDVAPNQEPKP